MESGRDLVDPCRGWKSVGQLPHFPSWSRVRERVTLAPSQAGEGTHVANRCPCRRFCGNRPVRSHRAGAQARTSESFQFSDPLTSNHDCDAFTVTIFGQEKGHVKRWFDTAGNRPSDRPHQGERVRQQRLDGEGDPDQDGHRRPHCFVAGTIALSGARNVSTEPGSGVVFQQVGHVVTGSDGQPISLSGKYLEFEAAYVRQDFCGALV